MMTHDDDVSDENPLEDLYVDQSDFDRARLRDALEGKIGIDRNSGEAVVLSGFSELSQSHKLLAFLMYRRATLELGHIDDDDLGLTTSELHESTGVPEGTIWSNPYSDLMTSSDEYGGYVIPNYALSDAIAAIEDNE